MKKILAFLLALSLSLSLSISASATSNMSDEVNLSDAYIGFSEELATRGISTNTCLEDFVASYELLKGYSVQQYIDSLITYELSLACRMDATINSNLQVAAAYIASHDSEATTYSDGGKWYDNIGINDPKLPQKASYETYNILSTVKKGDIIFETLGGFAAIVGHIAIVEGKFWDTTYKQYYIRTVEAVSPTVTHGVLDDSRYDYRGIKIYNVKDATSTQKSNAVDFFISQLGKPWSLEIPLLTECSYSSDTTNWYCSELAWAAYYNQGINLYSNDDSIPRHIYTPSSLAISSKLSRLDVE